MVGLLSGCVFCGWKPQLLNADESLVDWLNFVKTPLFPGNAKRILAAYRECLELGAELVVAPEMALCGYPPQDLLFKSQFVPKCLQALDYLADETGDVPRNAAAFLHKGKVLHKIWKTLLPSYDVYDERRYFEPGESCDPITWSDTRIGVTICEDIWTEDYLHRPLYDRDPAEELAGKGIDLLLNLSASPFSLGKPEQRLEMLAGVAVEAGVPLVYCNCVGGQDQLIFDGNSLALDAHGRPLAALDAFSAQCAVVDTSGEGNTDHAPAATCPEEECFKALTLGLRDYLVLACEALGAENVLGLTMPSQYSSGGSVDHSVELARNLGMECQTVPIGDAFEAVKSSMRPVFGDLPEDVTEENMQARIRGLFLMSLSNKTGRLCVAASPSSVTCRKCRSTHSPAGSTGSAKSSRGTPSRSRRARSCAPARRIRTPCRPTRCSTPFSTFTWRNTSLPPRSLSSTAMKKTLSAGCNAG